MVFITTNLESENGEHLQDWTLKEFLEYIIIILVLSIFVYALGPFPPIPVPLQNVEG